MTVLQMEWTDLNLHQLVVEEPLAILRLPAAALKQVAGHHYFPHLVVPHVH